MIEFESTPIEISNPSESFYPDKDPSEDYAQKDDIKKIFIFDDIKQPQSNQVPGQEPPSRAPGKSQRVYPKYSNEPSTVPLNSLKNSVEQNRLEAQRTVGNRAKFRFHNQEDVVGARVERKRSLASKPKDDGWKDDFKKQISKNLAKYQANQRSISSISSYSKFVKPAQTTSIESEEAKPRALVDSNLDFKEAMARNKDKKGHERPKLNLSYERQKPGEEMLRKVSEQYSKSQIDNQEPLVENIYDQIQLTQSLKFDEARPASPSKPEEEPQPQNRESLERMEMNLINDSNSKKNVYNVYNPEQKAVDRESGGEDSQGKAGDQSKRESAQSEPPKPAQLSNSISFNENQFGGTVGKKSLLSEVQTTEKAKEKVPEAFIDIFDMKEEKSREVETHAKESRQDSIVSSIRSISRRDSARNSAHKAVTQSGTKGVKSRLARDPQGNSRPPVLNRSQHIPRVSDFLAEKEENTIRKSKQARKKSALASQKNAKDAEKQSRRNNPPLSDQVLKMFLERQKEYRGRLENLEKKTDSSHRMLEELWGLGDTMKTSLDSLAQGENGGQQLVLSLEVALDKFERLTTDLKESQVLQKYWLDNLKFSSSKLETLVKRELGGQQSRCSEFFNQPQSVTSRTFHSYADPLNSESNSLFQRKVIGQSTRHQPRRQQYSVVGSQRMARNYRKVATKRLSQENNQMKGDKHPEKMFKKMSTEHNHLISPANFARRKTAQTHQIQRGSSKDTRTKNSKETVNSRKNYPKSKRGEEAPERISRDTEETWKQVKDKRGRQAKDAGVGAQAKGRKEEVYYMSNKVQLSRDKFESGQDAPDKELKKSQSNRLINKNLGQINIYHTSSKQKMIGALNNKSLPYLNAPHFADPGMQGAEQTGETKLINVGSQHSGVSIEFHMGSEKRGGGYRLGSPRQSDEMDERMKLGSPQMADSQREDFVIESIHQSKKSLNVKKEPVGSREEIIQLNHDFIKKETSQRRMPSHIVPSEVSETESGYETTGANYETNSTMQSEDQQKVVLGRPISPMMNAWEPKIDYTQGRPVGNIIYNPHMMHTAQSNFHVYPPNHSLTPQFPFYNNSNLYQKAQMIPAYDSSYGQNYSPHQSVQMQSNFRPVAPKNKRKKKKKKRFNPMGNQKFNQLNKLNQKILKKRAKKKGGARSGTYSEDFSQMSGNHSGISGKMPNVSSPMMSYANPSEHAHDSHYNSRYYYSKHDPNQHLNF